MPRIKFVAILAHISVLFCTLGCTRHLTTENICGNYSVIGNWGNSSLNIRGDGTFAQDVALLSGATYHLQGKWVMLDKNTDQYTRTIFFKPFLNMWSDELGRTVPNASFAIESIGVHGVWILVDADRETTYKRK